MRLTFQPPKTPTATSSIRRLPTPSRSLRPTAIPSRSATTVGETTPLQGHKEAQDGFRVPRPAEPAPAHPLQLSLDSLLPSRPADPAASCLQHERAAFLGTTLEDLLQVLLPMRLEALTRRIPSAVELHPSTREALTSLRTCPSLSSIRRFTLYTDGSFQEDSTTAGWAVGHDDTGDCWLGFASGRTGCDGCLSTNGPSAFAAEMDAMAFALAIVASCDGCTATIAFDCLSAAGIAMQHCTAHTLPGHAKGFAALRTIAAQRRNGISFRHVPAHTGDPFNECSDTLAKAETRGTDLCQPHREAFIQAFNNGELHHMWWSVSDLVPALCLPGLDDAGHLIPSSHVQPFVGDPLSMPGIPSCLHTTPVSVHQPRCWELKIATYNVTALCNAADEECLDAGFHKAGLLLVGIQEARKFPGPRSSTRHYTRFSSAGVDRNLGCQLWIHKSLAPVTGTNGPEPFCPGNAVLVHASPRILAVVLRTGGTSFGIIVGHAPTSAASDGEREDWWAQLDSVLGRFSRNAIPIMLLDANARVRAHEAGITFCSAEHLNHNAKCMASLLAERKLETTPLHLPNGQRPVTWTSPSGNNAQLDYVVMPDELASCSLTLGEPPGFVDHNGIDHKLLAVSVSWQAPVQNKPRIASFDTKAMCCDQGRAILGSIHANAPKVHWDVHPDTHLQVYNDYLFTELSKHFPMPLASPRQSHVTAEQWCVVRARRCSRRILHRIKTLRLRVFTAGIFESWRCACQQRPANDAALAFFRRAARLCFTEIRHVTTIRSLTCTFKQLAQRDAATHTRRSIAEARTAGPLALAHLLRGVLKTGRRYKAPRIQSLLEINGTTLTEPADITAALEAHFAVPEHGRQTTVPDLLELPELPASQTAIQLQDLPSLPDLVLGMQALQSGKAPGITGIPSEAFSQAPLDSSLAVFPIFLKGAIRQQVPHIWRGTKAIALQKPGKPAKSLASWRNIALYDVCAKGLGKAIRSLLCPALAAASARGQHGALKGQDIGAPSPYVHGYIRMAKAKCLSGAVVFLDGKSAYFSIMRQLLFPIDSSETNSALKALLATLEHSPSQQDAIIAAFAGPGLLAQGGVPASLVEYLQHSLHKSWFSLSLDTGCLQATGTGSVPGTPTADLLFQFIQSAFLKGLTRRLDEAGLLAKLAGCDEPGPQPAWADDVAILAPLGPASDVVPAVQRIVQLAEAESRAGGVLLNFSAGKTEALVILRGPGSRAERRLRLAQE